MAEELAGAVLLRAGHRQQLGLDERLAAGDPRDPLERAERIRHVVEHAEVQDDVELPERLEVHRREVGDDRLHLRVERRVGDVEAGPARELVGLPDLGHLVPRPRRLARAPRSARR